MRQVIIIFLLAILLSSCASFRNTADNSNRIMLTESNLALLNGRYERESIPLYGDLRGRYDLFSNFFFNSYSYAFGGRAGYFCRNHRRSGESIKLKVINRNRVLVSLIYEEEVLVYRAFQGRIRRGYFEFRRRHFFVPMVITNMYRNSRFRIGLSKENNLITDLRVHTFSTHFLIIPWYFKTIENDVEFRRIENVVKYSNE